MLLLQRNDAVGPDSVRSTRSRRRYRYLCLLAMGLFPVTGLRAQTDTLPHSYRFSLEQCVQYALEHQHDMVNARLDRRYAREVVGENRGKLLPHAQINGSFVDNLKLATTLIPDIFNGRPDEKIPVQFGNKFTSGITGQVDQTLLNSNYFLGLRAAKVYESLSARALDRTEAETRAGVAKAYYNVLVNQEAIRIAASNLGQLRKSLQDIRAKYEAGLAETVDVNRIEAQYNSAATGIANQRRLLAFSMEELKFQMGMPGADSLVLTQTVRDVAPASPSPADTAGFHAGARPEYQMQQVQVQLNELNLKSVRLGFLPSLSGFANYGFGYFASSFGDLYRKGYPNSQIGLNLSFPLFNGTERIHQANEARITLQQSRNDLQYLAEQISLEIRRAYVQYRNHLDQLDTQKKNMALTQGVYDRIKYKYDQGVATSLDLLSAENELQQSQSAYIEALLNVMLSKVDLDKALGRTASANPATP